MLKVENAPFAHKDHIGVYIYIIYLCGGPDEEGLFGEEEESETTSACLD
jgi:hypothetical protein